MTQSTQIITALDFSDSATALALAEKIDPALSRVKVGKELFTRSGPDVVKKLHSMGFELFLDLKFHDIPNTVAGAVRAAAELGVWMLNVHASGGERMLAAAKSAVDEVGGNSLIIAVTVLTSMDDDDLHGVGVPQSTAEQVVSLSKLAADSGLDGVVCSPHEVPAIKSHVASINDSFLTVTPGVRPATLNAADDQRRTMTPADAIRNGSDYLVIGRPITAAVDPNQALRSIYDAVATAA